MSKDNNSVLNAEIKEETLLNEETPKSVSNVISKYYNRQPLPELPRLFEIFTNLHDDEEMKKVIFLSTLPVAGTMFTKLKTTNTRSSDGTKEEYPDFMTYIYGKSGIGKSACMVPLKYLTVKLREKDNKEWQDFKPSKKGKNELPYQHILPEDITKAAALTVLSKSEGRAPIMYAEEVKGASDARKRGIHADLSTIDRYAYDRAETGELRLSSDFFSGKVQILWNKLFTGTKEDTFDYLSPQLIGGAARRILIYPFPDDGTYKNKKGGKAPSESELAELEEYMKKSIELIYHENWQVKEPHYIDMKWLDPTIDEWIDKMIEVGNDIKKANNVKADFFYRTLADSSAEIAMRASMLMYYLWEETEESKEKVKDFFLWFANFLQFEKFNLLADIMEDIMNAEIRKSRKNAMYLSVYNVLPEKFSRTQLKEELENAGYSREPRMVLSNWLGNELVKSFYRNQQIIEKRTPYTMHQ